MNGKNKIDYSKSIDNVPIPSATSVTSPNASANTGTQNSAPPIKPPRVRFTPSTNDPTGTLTSSPTSSPTTSTSTSPTTSPTISTSTFPNNTSTTSTAPTRKNILSRMFGRTIKNRGSTSSPIGAQGIPIGTNTATGAQGIPTGATPPSATPPSATPPSATPPSATPIGANAPIATPIGAQGATAPSKPSITIPNQLEITINTSVPGAQKIKFKPSMLDANEGKDGVVHFNPLIKLDESFVNNVPEDLRVKQFFSAGLFSSLNNFMDARPAKSLLYATQNGYIDNNIKVTLNTIFEENTVIKINGISYAIADVQWSKGSWKVDTKYKPEQINIRTVNDPYLKSALLNQKIASGLNQLNQLPKTIVYGSTYTGPLNPMQASATGSQGTVPTNASPTTSATGTSVSSPTTSVTGSQGTVPTSVFSPTTSARGSPGTSVSSPITSALVTTGSRASTLSPTTSALVTTGSRASRLSPSNFSPTQANFSPINTVPSNTVPSNTVPSNVAPSNAAPSNVAPSNTIQSNVAPSNTMQSNVAPSNVAPSNNIQASPPPLKPTMGQNSSTIVLRNFFSLPEYFNLTNLFYVEFNKNPNIRHTMLALLRLYSTINTTATKAINRDVYKDNIKSISVNNAVSDGNCFFDAVCQALNNHNYNNQHDRVIYTINGIVYGVSNLYTIAALRLLVADYIMKNPRTLRRANAAAANIAMNLNKIFLQNLQHEYNARNIDDISKQQYNQLAEETLRGNQNLFILINPWQSGNQAFSVITDEVQMFDFLLSQFYLADEFTIECLLFYMGINVITIQRTDDINNNGEDITRFSISYDSILSLEKIQQIIPTRNFNPWKKYIILYNSGLHYELVTFDIKKIVYVKDARNVIKPKYITKEIFLFDKEGLVEDPDDNTKIIPSIMPPIYIFLIIFFTSYSAMDDNEKQGYIFFPELMHLLNNTLNNLLTNEQTVSEMVNNYAISLFPLFTNPIASSHNNSSTAISHGGRNTKTYTQNTNNIINPQGYPGYGAPSYPGYSSPSYPGYGAPSYPGYSSSSYPGYGAPSYPGYGSPSYPGYGAPSYPGYGSPSYPGYGYPGYGSPVTKKYNQPTTITSGDNSNISYYITIDMELYPGKSIPTNELINLKCARKWNTVRKSFSDFTGKPYVIPPVYKTPVYSKNKTKKNNTKPQPNIKKPQNLNKLNKTMKQNNT